MKILNKNNKEISSLDLGILEAGTSKTYEFYLLNDSEAEVVDVKLEIANKEVSILSYPQKMSAGSKELFTIKWSPTLTIKKGLQTLIKVNATELYR